jgi:hypothetical protein
MRNSCTELRNVTHSYAEFLSSCQEFITAHQVCPALPESLCALTSAFDIFSQQVVSLFSAVRRSSVSRNFSHVSPLFQSAETFTLKWTSFIELVNNVGDSGVSPCSQEVSNSFACLGRILAQIEVQMRQKCCISRSATRFIAKSRRVFACLQQKLEDIILISQEGVAVELRPQKYLTFFRNYAIEMNAILDRVLPADVFLPIETSKMKIDVSVACSALGQIVHSTSTFHIHMGDLKTKIVQLNAQLADLHRFLNLPFTVVLTVEDRTSLGERAESGQAADARAASQVFVA